MSSSSEDDSSESSVGEVVEVEAPPLKKAEDGEVVEVEAPTNLKKAEDVKNSSRRFSLSSDTDTETGTGERGNGLESGLADHLATPSSNIRGHVSSGAPRQAA